MYPSYIDSSMSVKDGRKVRADLSCENPTVQEVAKACIQLGLDCLIEPKRYPKKWWVPGRCRIRIHNADGSPCNKSVNSRKELFHEVGKVIPQIRQQMREQMSASQKGGPAPAGSQNKAKPKGKGKGRKK
ncbi:uncharacterized protein [Blastocystis hominis]|uniref:Signal recognition particle 19 kDa protein n=1 Tax=Blastocystis hominis TaxID=12968 RepID=D8M9I5_BLAHO|nr:uncharacterized protein [Blastocystis hominis]CBK24724.2 unnamed protein product [Blastocystis hominis]|eukprot:XP_012898772.1 uncharacterized protein [Blastocystis hominis]